MADALLTQYSGTAVTRYVATGMPPATEAFICSMFQKVRTDTRTVWSNLCGDMDHGFTSSPNRAVLVLQTMGVSSLGLYSGNPFYN